MCHKSTCNFIGNRRRCPDSAFPPAVPEWSTPSPPPPSLVLSILGSDSFDQTSRCINVISLDFNLHFPATNNVEYLIVCLFTIRISSFEVSVKNFGLFTIILEFSFRLSPSWSCLFSGQFPLFLIGTYFLLREDTWEKFFLRCNRSEISFHFPHAYSFPEI